METGEDQQDHQRLSSITQEPASFSCPFMFNSGQDQGACSYRELHQMQRQDEVDDMDSRGKSCDHPWVENKSASGLKLSLWKEEEGTQTQSVKWMSSKMRMMRKMMNPDQGGADTQSNSSFKYEDQRQLSSPMMDTENSSNGGNATIRVCSDCNTTKTPLWRSGPRGPKSLCNACGIRQRKARRAMAAAAAAASGAIQAAGTINPPSGKSKAQHKDKRSSFAPQFKKRCKQKTGSRERKKTCVEDLTLNLNLSKSSAFQRVFPQDEKEAAILLMALSCGLVRG